ncbi:MAG: alginate lyase family protein [Microbacterium sp.]|jgi:hypothetical protein|nr:alginate lyase family protein [Microbacterium sp.]
MSLLGAERVRTMSHPSKLPEMPFWTAGRKQTLLDMLGPLNTDGTSNVAIPRVRVEWNRVAKANTSYAIKGPISPFKIPSTYREPEEEKAAVAIVDGDTNACADLAMRWFFLGDSAAAAKAVSILTAWSSITVWDNSSGATTPLVWASRMTRLIQASFLLRNYSGYTTAVHNAFRALILRGIDGGASPTSGYTNNVGAWGVAYDIACAKFLNDRPLLLRSLNTWRRYFDINVVGNVPIHEIHRQGGIINGDGSTGLWYSNFLVYALAVGAEWARFSGEWLYDHEGPDGSTFKELALLVRYWTRNPALFPYNTSGTPSETVRSLPHDEILHALWPNADSEWILANFPNGSDRDSHGVRGSVLIYRGRPLYG